MEDQNQAVWYYLIDDQQNGPMTLSEIQGLVQQRRTDQDIYIWQEGWSDWKPLREVLPRPVHAAAQPVYAPTDDQANQTVQSQIPPIPYQYTQPVSSASKPNEITTILKTKGRQRNIIVIVCIVVIIGIVLGIVLGTTGSNIKSFSATTTTFKTKFNSKVRSLDSSLTIISSFNDYDSNKDSRSTFARAKLYGTFLVDMEYDSSSERIRNVGIVFDSSAANTDPDSESYFYAMIYAIDPNANAKTIMAKLDANVVGTGVVSVEYTFGKIRCSIFVDPSTSLWCYACSPA